MSKKTLTVLVAVLALALVAVSVLFSLEKSSGAQLSAELETLSAVADARGAEIESLTADAEQKAAAIESLTADAAQKAAAIESLTADVEDRDAQIESLSADVEEKAAAIASLSTDVEEKAAAIESLTADVEARDAQIAALTADAEDRDAAIESLTADAAQKDAAIESLTADAEQKDAAIESLTADAEQKDAAIESLTADLEDREAEVADLNAALALLQALPEPGADVEDAFDVTRYFLQACKGEGLLCRYYGTDDDGDDCITVVQGGHIPFSVQVRFRADSRRVPFLIWQYIHFSAIDRPELIELCNKLNKSYPDVTFLVDDWDNSVSIRGAMVFSEHAESAEEDFGAFRELLRILRETEEDFLPYAQ